MKKIIPLIFLVSFSCFAQTINKDLHLTISKAVNQEDQQINQVIATVRSFLETKNNSYTSNEFWLTSDFEKHLYPYLDLYQIENGKEGKNTYQPTLMEVIQTKNKNKWIVKLAFISHNSKTNENQIRGIYNIIASKINNEIVFSRYQDFILELWQHLQKESVSYYISPLKKINEEEVKQQQKDIEMLCNFFNTKPIPLTYISCINPKEVFEVKGFDYNPMMYVSKVGGLAEYGNIILSGNNSEIYTHEIIHIYTLNLFPNKHSFFDEGLATYLSGSGTFDYLWHKEKFKRFIQKNPDFKIENHIDDLYERLYFEEETSIPYLIAAAVCERTIRLYGKERFFELLNSKDDLWVLLNKIGLTKENINQEIRKELKL
ncbi:hypothetical protein NU10_10475 [Flavobacterium dauae]|uniref:hypothetical protein n=1 Tax=Flavobacterium dauae TaxID=1563479 RepID=UPI00101B2B38|nr:hypothetical protein [Flavobacterium dauae]WLD23130.1 hypothetical protein NU10_10475 [Flavobacterium dauae]